MHSSLDSHVLRHALRQHVQSKQTSSPASPLSTIEYGEEGGNIESKLRAIITQVSSHNSSNTQVVSGEGIIASLPQNGRHSNQRPGKSQSSQQCRHSEADMGGRDAPQQILYDASISYSILIYRLFSLFSPCSELLI